jgi:plastocyanin
MIRIVAFAFSLALALASTAALAEDVIVRIGHNRITPAEVTVKAGTAVTFVNEDEMPGGHSIVADDGSFESPGLGKDERWSYTFAAPGSHGYAIKQHPAAKGKVIVE